jgi:hypothetical protein
LTFRHCAGDRSLDRLRVGRRLARFSFLIDEIARNSQQSSDLRVHLAIHGSLTVRVTVPA